MLEIIVAALKAGVGYWCAQAEALLEPHPHPHFPPPPPASQQCQDREGRPPGEAGAQHFVHELESARFAAIFWLSGVAVCDAGSGLTNIPWWDCLGNFGTRGTKRLHFSAQSYLKVLSSGICGGLCSLSIPPSPEMANVPHLPASAPPCTCKISFLQEEGSRKI